MRLIIIIFTTVMTLQATPQPVAFVDPAKFSGLWYEIARTYNRYEKDCVAATVEYTLSAEAKYQVNNRCFDTVVGGDLIEYEGSAEPAEGQSMSRIDLTYFWIFTREYRVIHLEPDYSSAVVTDEKMEQLWIMHREPFMPQERLGDILTKLEASMDLNRLIYTPQDPQGRYR